MTTTTRDAKFLDARKRLSNVLEEEEDPTVALRQMAEIICSEMDSNGAKAYIVSRSPDGLGIRQVCRTDFETQVSRTLELSETRGLADWVVQSGEWLLVKKMPPSLDESVCAISEGGETIVRPARFEAEYLPNLSDNEQTMLIVPLDTRRPPAGALVVWRTEERPYDNEDAEKLVEFAPHIASACKQLIHVWTSEDELRALSKCAGRLRESTDRMNDAYDAVAQGVGRLAAAHVVLLQHDSRHAHQLFYRTVWSSNDSTAEKIRNSLSGFRCPADITIDGWDDKVAFAIEDQIKESGLENLVCRRVFVAPREQGVVPELMIALLDPESVDKKATLFADNLQEHYSHSFLSYARTLVANHAESCARAICDEVGTLSIEEPNEVLIRTGESLMRATGADVALIYAGGTEEASVIHAMPNHPEQLYGMVVDRPSEMWSSIQSKKIGRVVQVPTSKTEAERVVGKRVLERVRESLEWQGVRSWMGCPVIHEDQCFGFIQLLTSKSGPFLGGDHESIASRIVGRAAREFHEVNHLVMKNELNQMADEFATCEEELAKVMIEALESWAARFVGQNTRVAIIARTVTDRIVMEAASPQIEKHLESLSELSRQWGKEYQEWSGRQVFELPGPDKRKANFNLCGVAIPYRLPRNSKLRGHLCFLQQDQFTQIAFKNAQEAAREMSSVLHSEVMTSEIRQRIGRLTHAVWGPVQGLQEAALDLGYLATKPDADRVEINDCTEMVHDEIKRIQEWNNNQKLLRGEFEILKSPTLLKPLFNQCIRRFRREFRIRHLKVHIDWQADDHLTFDFDENAIDLALSNLLDNARKYAFKNREVRVGAASKASKVKIWVEDIGHPIPEYIAKEIYKEDRRLDWKDPFRTISGFGLGLPMTKAVVDAHGGRLEHSCRPAAVVTEGNKAPFRVRFTIELPMHGK